MDHAVATLAQRGTEYGPPLCDPDFSVEALRAYSRWIKEELGGYRLLDPKPDWSDSVGELGAYCGETMRLALGGTWAWNPEFPDYPGLRCGDKWVYPFGLVEQYLDRVTNARFTPYDYLCAYREGAYLSGGDPSVCDGDGPLGTVEADPQKFKTLARSLVETLRDRFGFALDGSVESLALLDPVLDRLGLPSSPERRDLQRALAAYIGEVLLGSAGGVWLECKTLGPTVRIPASGGKHTDVFVAEWANKALSNWWGGHALQDSLSLKARIYLDSRQ